MKKYTIITGGKATGKTHLVQGLVGKLVADSFHPVNIHYLTHAEYDTLRKNNNFSLGHNPVEVIVMVIDLGLDADHVENVKSIMQRDGIWDPMAQRSFVVDHWIFVNRQLKRQDFDVLDKERMDFHELELIDNPKVKSEVNRVIEEVTRGGDKSKGGEVQRIIGDWSPQGVAESEKEEHLSEALTVYIASSWKNQHGVELLTMQLREMGFLVLSWIENNFGENPDAAGNDFDFEKWMKSESAIKSFHFDTNGAAECDLFIYYGTGGKDCMAECGIAFSSAIEKDRVMYALKSKGEDLGLMRLMFDIQFSRVQDLLKEVARIKPLMLERKREVEHASN